MQNRTSRTLNFNVFNLRKQTAGCLGEAKKDPRKIIRHLEKITKPAEKITKDLEKITKHLVPPSPGLLGGIYKQQETEEALLSRKSSVLHCKDTTFFSEKQIGKIAF